MAAPKVKVDVGADAKGFNKVMTGVEDRLKGLGKGGFGGGIFGAISGGGISGLGAMTGMGAVIGASVAAAAAILAFTINTAKFAKEMEETAARLNITTVQAQQLSFAAELMGKDLGFLETMIHKVDTFAEKALVRGSKEAEIAEKLGIAREQLSHLDDVELTKLIARKAVEKKLGTADLDVIGGKKGGRELKEAGEQIEKSEKYGLTLDPRAIAAMHDEWEKFTIVLHDGLTILKRAAAGFVILFRMIKVLSDPRTYLKLITGNWKDVIEDLKLATGRGLVKPVDVTNREPPTEKPEALGPMGSGNNQFLKIGGLMGIDTSYRIERLLAMIEQNTRKENVSTPITPPSTSPFPVSQPLAPSPARVAGPSGFGQAGSPGLSSQNAPVFNPAMPAKSSTPAQASSPFKRNLTE
jgi:hypothetical protein